MRRHCYRLFVFSSLISVSAFIIGCGSGESTSNEEAPKDNVPAPSAADEPPALSQQQTQSYSSSITLSPEEKLRKIALRGKSKAQATAGAGWTFVDVRVESSRASSLNYPLVGRLYADYKMDGDSRLGRWVVYYKYDGDKWLFAKYDTWLVGERQAHPLTEDLVLSPPARPVDGVIERDDPKWTIWLP